MSRQVQSLREELVLKSKNWRLSQQLMKYTRHEDLQKLEKVEGFNKRRNYLKKELSKLQEENIRNILIMGGKSTLAKVLRS